MFLKKSRRPTRCVSPGPWASNVVSAQFRTRSDMKDELPLLQDVWYSDFPQLIAGKNCFFSWYWRHFPPCLSLLPCLAFWVSRVDTKQGVECRELLFCGLSCGGRGASVRFTHLLDTWSFLLPGRILFLLFHCFFYLAVHFAVAYPKQMIFFSTSSLTQWPHHFFAL